VARRLAALVASLPLVLLGAVVPATAAQTGGPLIIQSSHNDLSAPLTSLSSAGDDSTVKVKPHREVPGHRHVGNSAVQGSSSASVATIPSTALNFDGVGQGFSGPSGTFIVNSAPPDTNGATGPNHYIQIVNTDFAIFNKSGTTIYGPVPINTLWSGFGGLCQTDNDGDPTVVYDRLADRFVISQFAITGADGSATPFQQCVAVSQGGDPTGSYYRYSFPYSYFNDYPKMAVWPDAYYVTSNKFNAAGTTFLGAAAAAMDRSKMLAGQPATQQVFSTSTTYGGILPSHVDSAMLPPAGAPNHLVGLGSTTSTIAYWNYHVDWTNSSNSTFSGPTELSVAAYAEACGGGTCIPQSGTRQQLDSLADRVMNRLAYRNFGDHEAMVVNHSVTVGSAVGVRWYELRVGSGNTLSVFQQGTYAPDSTYRWMGSIAMDQAGDMALGYSASSSNIHPQIRYTGRLVGDPAGTMTQGEATIIAGAGSQTRSLSRWGDYSSMTVDPSDDCTFWYTNQYIPANGAFNWKTRVGTFKFPSCGGAPPPNDFSISANPSSVSVQQGGSGISTISTAIVSGSAESISLAASGVPAGTTANLNPASLNTGGSSTLTLTVGTSTATGSYSITVTGTSASNKTHSTTVALTVTAPVANDFSISANPSSLSVQQGASGASTISTALVSGSAESITLSATGMPAGTTAGFNPAGVSAGGSSTLTLTVASSTAAGTYTITVTGTATSATHSTNVSLTVTAPVVNDFSISANPSSVSVQQGASGTSTISTALVSGSAQTISLAASGAPSGTTASLNPTSVSTGGSATLTLAVGTGTATGSYPITVTGTATSTHSTTVALTVTAPPPGGIVNGGFETGNLSGWTSVGTTAVVTGGHSGTYAARVGGTSPTNGDSSIAQTFIAPSTGGALSFWYLVVCPDTLTYDWATATLTDNTANSTSTMLGKTCANSGTWVQSAASNLVGSHSYTLTLTSHDDNYPSDPTYTLYDDVAIGAAPPPPPTGITNGGFETGNLSGWTAAGTTAVVTGGHSGTYAAQVGGTSPTNGDSSVAQTFTASTGSTTLGVWYKVVCPDTLTYDWATATLRDNTAGTTATVLAKTCTNNGVWVQATAAVTAGHSYTLTLISHDDNYAADPTYTLYDDVTLT